MIALEVGDIIMRELSQTPINIRRRAFLAEHRNDPEWMKRYSEKKRLRDTTYREKNREEYNRRCRDWRHFPHRKMKNGIWTRGEKAEAIERQHNLCAICGTNLQRSHADHDHKTLAKRGILCSYCNWGLGNFRDNPEVLEKAAQYIRSYSEGRKS